MTRFISILLLTGILLQTFSKVVIFVNYEINKEYITKKYCENKNKPKMHCNGKCHMVKQLNEEDKKENSPLNNLKEKFEVQLFSQDRKTTLFEIYLTGENTFSAFQLSKTSNPSFSVFHPPTC
ncbi:MAG: hypothetical protein K8R85_04665 [Bacteroidetes bacterium]|nr:hypothetical protein [Bacteroidota bacterium]